MTDAKEYYAGRIAAVLCYIGQHLDDELSVERLAEVAGFSPYHFHRQFREFTGISVGKLVARMRLKRAALQLAFSPDERVLDIALAAGFESPEAFARAFKRAQQQSPSEFRRAPAWERWSDLFRSPLNTRSDPMESTH